MSVTITLASDQEPQTTDDNITIDLTSMGSYDHSDYYTASGATIPTLTISDLSGITTTSTGVNYPNVWTTTGTSIHPGSWDTQASGKITLAGEDADIEINGESLVGMLKSMQERMNILTVNTKLEAEWEELRALGDQYRALEKHILEKQATWDRLKAMPPPIVD